MDQKKAGGGCWGWLAVASVAAVLAAGAYLWAMDGAADQLWLSDALMRPRPRTSANTNGLSDEGRFRFSDGGASVDAATIIIEPPPPPASNASTASRSGGDGTAASSSSDATSASCNDKGGPISTTPPSASSSLPWYARGRTWHYPVRFPRCSMDACFDYSRCANRSELLVYSYTAPSAPLRYFARMVNRTAWHTDDPGAACLFFAYLEINPPYPMEPHPSALPHWGANGSNHVLVTFADKWKDLGLAAESIGYAAVMASDMHETVYRAGFDVSMTLPGLANARLEPLLLGAPPGPRHRRYLATFRGLRYLNSTLFMEGTLRSYASFRGMHNGRDVVVATSCRHGNNDAIRRHDPSTAAHCDEDQAVYDAYSYDDLMNTTFGLVPAGWSPNSYRLVEVLSAGAIPVLIVDNYVKPFDTLIQWHRCALQFPSSQIHLVVPTLRAMLARHLRHFRRQRLGDNNGDGDGDDNDNNNDNDDNDNNDDNDIHDELSRRHRYCVHIYKRYLRDDDALLASAIASLKARLFGAVPYDDPPLK